MTKADDSDAKPGKSDSRDKRLAAALRENLRRRKAQARGRGAAGRRPAPCGEKGRQSAVSSASDFRRIPAARVAWSAIDILAFAAGPPAGHRSAGQRKAGGAAMDRIRITGGQRLNGTIPISGAKNATLPLMIAGLLTEDTLILENVPRLADVIQLQRILGNHGVDITIAGKRPGDDPNSGRTIHISAKTIVDTTAPYELVSKMRASFWVVAPLVARMGEAKVSMPGGCAIGTRPVDLLIMALQALGAEIEIEAGYVIARAKNGLRGGEIVFPKVTVGGTHTALMAASLAKGTTVIENAAREPEIGDVADCLNKMGAKITGAGTSRIVVEGVPG